jgi:PAS domain S-box-containing protein
MSDCDESMIIVIDARPGVTVPAFRRSCGGTAVSPDGPTERFSAGEGHHTVTEDRTMFFKIGSPKLEPNSQGNYATEPETEQGRFHEVLSHLSIEANPDAFVAVDLDNRIVNWNTKASTLFGWSKEEAIGQTLWETIIPPRFHNAHWSSLHRFRKTGEALAAIRRIELMARHRHGHEFPVEITISGPIHSESGVFFGAFLRDISTRREREEELRQAKEEAESQARTLKILNGISREISALLNCDDLLRHLSELLYQLVEYDTVSVLLLDSSGEILKHRFSLSGSQLIEKPDISIDQGIVGFAARTRLPVAVGDVNSDPRYIKFHENTRSELSVPLIVKDRLIGVLDLESTEHDYFRESQVQTISIFASQLAIALDNSILYERVSAQERQLNQDLRFARQLQKRLLSDDLPVMKNAAISTLSWPARIIAGDIFDFAYYNESALHVGILGDVMGKGAPAALYAALTSGIIRLLVERELDPATMLKTVNQALLERPLDSQFVALLFTLWDDQRLALTIANSGLPRPLHCTNGRVKVIEAVGTPLGLLPGINYEQHVVQAAPGDVFIFLTDGILEARNKQGEEFGYHNLARTLRGSENLSVNEIRDRVANAITAHCERIEPADDQTLIVFKVQQDDDQEFRQPQENLRVRTDELSLG